MLMVDTVTTEVFDQFISSLDALGVEHHLNVAAHRNGRGHQWDASGSIEGVDVVVEVMANPTVGDVLHLAQEDSKGAFKVLAARHLWRPVREALDSNGMGRFDSRGQLRLWHRPLLIDATVLAPVVPTAPRRLRLESLSALDVALAVLDGTAAIGVRASAAAIGRSPGTVSKQLAALRGAYLVDDEARPLVPALFDAVVAEWHPTRVPLAEAPRSVAVPANDRLGTGFADLTRPGWVLADTFAAVAWSAPVVLTADSPPDFYVPDATVLARARAMFGEADYGRHACTVAVAPAPYVCRRRFDRGEAGRGFPAPSAIVAALDLAVDLARGREVLEMWTQDLLPELPRVW